MGDLGRFLGVVDPIMKPGLDCLWIMGGKTDSNVASIKKLLLKCAGLKYVGFYVNYDTKLMQLYGHWKRQGGMANSQSLEQIFFVYKGRRPNHPKIRKFVDSGSALFHQVMNNVPVLAPEHHAFVSKEVRDKSLSNMCGTPQDMDPDVMAKKQLEDEAAAEAQRETDSIDPVVVDQPSDDQAELEEAADVEWFPHDVDIELMKELVWEAGGPRWVLLGTPASGAAVHGSFEMGCSVVALCADEHHRTHLLPAIVVRAVEAMASQSSRVFKHDVLHERSLLDLSRKQKTGAGEDSDEDSDASASSDSDAPKESPNKKVKTSPKPNPPQKKKNVTSRSSSDSSRSSRGRGSFAVLLATAGNKKEEEECNIAQQQRQQPQQQQQEAAAARSSRSSKKQPLGGSLKCKLEQGSDCSIQSQAGDVAPALSISRVVGCIG